MASSARPNPGLQLQLIAVTFIVLALGNIASSNSASESSLMDSSISDSLISSQSDHSVTQQATDSLQSTDNVMQSTAISNSVIQSTTAVQESASQDVVSSNSQVDSTIGATSDGQSPVPTTQAQVASSQVDSTSIQPTQSIVNSQSSYTDSQSNIAISDSNAASSANVASSQSPDSTHSITASNTALTSETKDMTDSMTRTLTVIREHLTQNTDSTRLVSLRSGNTYNNVASVTESNTFLSFMFSSSREQVESYVISNNNVITKLSSLTGQDIMPTSPIRKMDTSQYTSSNEISPTTVHSSFEHSSLKMFDRSMDTTLMSARGIPLTISEQISRDVKSAALFTSSIKEFASYIHSKLPGISITRSEISSTNEILHSSSRSTASVRRLRTNITYVHFLSKLS